MLACAHWCLLQRVENGVTRATGLPESRLVPDREYTALFLCTGNSARSIMAECALNRWGKGKFLGLSAGSHPKGEVHPLAIELLQRLHYDTSTLRSKSWDEFEGPGSPHLDFIFTVCDNAAAETCPIWPGRPVSAHWGVADPAAFHGSVEERREVFLRTYRDLETSIKIFVSLPIEGLDACALSRRLKEIGQV